jgi:curli biogenesis system outer membrane secretion channel CsgG
MVTLQTLLNGSPTTSAPPKIQKLASQIPLCHTWPHLAHIAVQSHTKGFTMTISEAQRFDMQLGLRSHLGDDVANILMEHLPPSGWSDVARKQDIVEIRNDLSRINGTLKVIIGGVLTVSAAIIVLLIQLNQNISSL